MRTSRCLPRGLLTVVGLTSALCGVGCDVANDWNTDDQNPQGNPVVTVLETQRVNDQGGTVVADNATIEIPAGAVNSPIDISVGTVTSPGRPVWTESRVGPGRYFGPVGMVFNKPVTITLPYNIADVGNQDALSRMLVFAMHAGETDWLRVAGATINAGESSVTITTTRLSTFILTLLPRSQSSYGSFGGTVTDEGGTAVPGVTVTADPERVYAVTDDEGKYEINWLIPARFTLHFTHPAFVTGERVADTVGGTTTTVDEALTRDTTGTGALRVLAMNADSDSAAVRNATVTILDGPTTAPTATTDASGIASLQNLPGGEYTIKVAAAQLQDGTYGGVTVVAGQWTVLAAALSASTTGEPGSVSGFVRNGDGAPIEGARVEITSGPRDIGRAVTADATGSYSIDLLPAGNYSFRVTADGYDTLDSPTIVVDPGEETLQDFVLSPQGTGDLGSIAGFVRDVDGNPIVGAEARIMGGPETGSTTTDNDGAYELANLTPGTYTVRYAADGFDTQTATGIQVTAGEQTTYHVTLDVAQADTGAIVGLVLDAGATAISGATVAITGGPSNVGTSVQTDVVGHYELSGLDPGSYTLQASKTGYQSATASGVNVTAGGQTARNFALAQQ